MSDLPPTTIFDGIGHFTSVYFFRRSFPPPPLFFNLYTYTVSKEIKFKELMNEIHIILTVTKCIIKMFGK